MVRFVRRTGLAALGGLLLGMPAYAQQTAPQPAPSEDSVGPPALSDFELRPDNPLAPPPQSGPTIAPLAPPPGAQAQQPPPASELVVSIAPPPAPVGQAPERSSTPERVPSPAPQRGVETPNVDTPAPVEAEPAPTIADDLQAAPTPELAPASPLTQADPAPDQPTAIKPDSSGPSLWWLYLLLAGLIAGVGIFALRRKGRAAPVMAGRAAMPVTEAPMPAPPSSPAPAAPRPWIELEFKPSEAGANDNQAAIKFELMLRNVGEGEARDVRVEARMFNAGTTQDKEISAFFSRPGPNSVTAPVPMQPQTQIPYRSVVHLPRDKVREINVQGRRLFIPMVAVNVRYRWGDTEWGQTSASYLVGVEGNPPAEKMGAFRLDLGPRIYRKVGQREHSLSRRL